MSANIAWGPAVLVDGKPDWVNPHDLIRWSNNGRPYQEVVAGQVRQWGDHDNRITIRLGCDHPHYAQIAPAPDAVTPRDTVARIIDPYVWEDGDDTHGAYMARSIALEKADEIIAALATPATSA